MQVYSYADALGEIRAEPADLPEHVRLPPRNLELHVVRIIHLAGCRVLYARQRPSHRSVSRHLSLCFFFFVRVEGVWFCSKFESAVGSQSGVPTCSPQIKKIEEMCREGECECSSHVWSRCDEISYVMQGQLLPQKQ